MQEALRPPSGSPIIGGWGGCSAFYTVSKVLTIWLARVTIASIANE